MRFLLILLILFSFLILAGCRGPTEPIGQTELTASKPIIILYEHNGIIDTLIIASQ